MKDRDNNTIRSPKGFKMTVAYAKTILGNADCTLKKVEDEYQVIPRWVPSKKREACTYFTDDIMDAIDTGFAMFEREYKRLGAKADRRY